MEVSWKLATRGGNAETKLVECMPKAPLQVAIG